MKRSDSIALLELNDALSNTLDDPSDVVTLVHWRMIGHPFWNFPCFPKQWSERIINIMNES